MAIKQQYRGGAKKATVLLNNMQPTKITMQVPKIAKIKVRKV